MDDYRSIEVEFAKRFGVEAKSTRKSIGDFYLNDDLSKPVNVKSNNVDKKNYSPNIISGKKLIEWVLNKGNELHFIFVDYEKIDGKIEIIRDSGLIPFYHLSWDCLSIEAQGWGVIQMNKDLKIDKNQTQADFFKGMKVGYEKYIGKEERKMTKIREMIKDF
ncbi:MAG: hypothetical protein AB8G86_17600 [Saprospiraceae bacterium]